MGEKTKAMAEPILDWVLSGIPSNIKVKLLDDVGFIYEAQLAKMELSTWWKNPDEFVKRAAYFEEVNGKKTYHCNISDIRGKGQIGRTCQYLTHWFYPYKAKFHPQMIKALINWMGLKNGENLLDPFVGSGTALIEAKTINVNSIGIDINPVCILMSQVKCDLLDLPPTELEKVSREKIFHHFHEKGKKLIKAGASDLSDFVSIPSKNISDLTSDERVYRFFQLCYLYALSDFRYVKKDMWKGFNENLDLILETIKKFDKLKNELDMRLGEVDVQPGDARALPFPKNHVHGIVTSPPYSIAVNYIKQDIHALGYLNINPQSLRKDLVGLRGNGDERIKNYYNDMLQAFNEMHRVLKPKRYCITVIGDITYRGKRLPIHRKYIEFAEKADFTFVDMIRRPILGGYARLRYEYILIFRKD